MTQWLEEAEPVTVKMGPFVDDGDGVTEEEGLTIAQGDIRVTMNGGNIVQSNNAAGATHDELGYYGVPLDATDTGTLGTLRVAIHASGALPVWQDFMIVPTNVWDAMFGADKLQVHAAEITAGLITATALGADCLTAAKIADNAIAAEHLATDAIGADALAASALAEINTECDTALTDYDPPTKAEMDTAHGLLATEAKQDVIDGIVDNILVDTGTTLPATLSSLDGALSTVDGIVDDILVDTGTTLPATLATIDSIVDTILVDTGTTLQAELDGIQTDTEDIQTQIGTAGAGLTDLGAMSTAMKAEVESECNDALVALSLDSVATAAELRAEIDLNSTQLKAIVLDTGTTMPATITTIDGIVDDILVDTAEIGTAGAGLTDLGGMSTAMKAEAESECNDALIALHLDHVFGVTYDPASKPGVADALFNELVENDGGTARFTQNALEQGPSGTESAVLISTTVASITSQTEFVITAGADFNDAYVDQSIVLSDASNNDYPSIRKVSTYVGATKTVTINEAPDFTIAASGDGVKIFQTAPGTTAPTVEQVREEMDSNSAQLDAIVLDTGTTLPATLATIDGIVDNILVDTATTIPATIATVDGIVDNILVDTAEIGTAGASLTDLGGMSTAMKAEVNAEADTALSDYDPPTKTEMDTGHGLLATEAKQDVIDGIVDSILADTGTDGVALTAASVDAILDEVVEGSYTVRHYLRLFAAALLGKVSGADGNAPVFRDTADNKARITATTDANGNRTAVTLVAT